MLYRKFVRKKTIIKCFIWICDLPKIGFPVVKVENFYCQNFLMFHRTDFGGFLVCRYKAIQQLNGVEKNSVAISLMLNHNLTELLPQLNVKYPKFWILVKTTKDSYFWEIRQQSYSKSALKHNPFLWSWTSMKKTIFPDPGRKQK